MADLDHICANFKKLKPKLQAILKDQTEAVEGDLSEYNPDLAKAVKKFRNSLK